MANKHYLSDAGIRAAMSAGKSAILGDAECDGLRVRITESGLATFAYRYQLKVGDKIKRPEIKIGRYRAVSLSEARRIARGYATDRDRGIDPWTALKMERRRQLKEAEAAKRSDMADAEAPSLQTAWELYETDVVDDAATGANMRSLYNLYWADWADRKLHDLDRTEIRNRLEDIGHGRGRFKRKGKTGGVKTQSNRAHETIRAILNNAMRHELIGTNPARLNLPRRRKALFKEQPRDRYPTLEEIARIWIACDGLNKEQARAVRFAICCLKRRAEICGAKPNRVDRAARIWTIPGAETKSGKPDRVPVSELMLTLLPLSGPWVFPGQAKGTNISVGTLTRWFSQAATLAKIDEHITLHDLRRGGATFVEENGFSRTVSAMMLGHTQTEGGQATHHYTGNVSLSSVRLRALEVWQNAILDEVARLEDKNVNKVTPKR